MAQQMKISKNNTNVYIGDDGSKQVYLHNTCVVHVHPSGTVVLYTGGWLTPTTVTRMNQAANQWNLGFSVSRAGGELTAIFRDGSKMVSADAKELRIPADRMRK